MHMGIMLLQFVKVERIGNWCLHLAAISSHMIANYAYWLPAEAEAEASQGLITGYRRSMQ